MDFEFGLVYENNRLVAEGKGDVAIVLRVAQWLGEGSEEMLRRMISFHFNKV
jgi:hypothetical protein